MEAEFFLGFLSYISEENRLTEYYSTFKMFISRTKAGSIPLPVSQYLTPLYEYFGKFYSEEPSLPVRSREGIQHYYKSVGLIHLVLIEKFPCRNAERYVLLAIHGIIDIWLLIVLANTEKYLCYNQHCKIYPRSQASALD